MGNYVLENSLQKIIDQRIFSDSAVQGGEKKSIEGMRKAPPQLRKTSNLFRGFSI